jgi:hypothetical protein
MTLKPINYPYFEPGKFVKKVNLHDKCTTKILYICTTNTRNYGINQSNFTPEL